MYFNSYMHAVSLTVKISKNKHATENWIIDMRLSSFKNNKLKSPGIELRKQKNKNGRAVKEKKDYYL